VDTPACTDIRFYRDSVDFDQTDWKVSGKIDAAEILWLKESTLHARMNKLGIK
jgi:hypothetical protein